MRLEHLPGACADAQDAGDCGGGEPGRYAIARFGRNVDRCLPHESHRSLGRSVRLTQEDGGWNHDFALSKPKDQVSVFFRYPTPQGTKPRLVDEDILSVRVLRN